MGISEPLDVVEDEPGQRNDHEDDKRDRNEKDAGSRKAVDGRRVVADGGRVARAGTVYQRWHPSSVVQCALPLGLVDRRHSVGRLGRFEQKTVYTVVENFHNERIQPGLRTWTRCFKLFSSSSGDGPNSPESSNLVLITLNVSVMFVSSWWSVLIVGLSIRRASITFDSKLFIINRSVILSEHFWRNRNEYKTTRRSNWSSFDQRAFWEQFKSWKLIRFSWPIIVSEYV